MMTKFASGGLTSIIDQVRAMHGQAGIACFTPDPRSILMWSHYAAKHTGICLQFEALRSSDPFGRVLPVEYVHTYPSIDVINDRQRRDFREFLWKSAGWSYERELRIVAFDGARSYIAYPPEALTGLIFGCRATSDIVGVVDDLIRERVAIGLPNVRLYRAKAHSSRYRIQIASNAPMQQSRRAVQD